MDVKQLVKSVEESKEIELENVEILVDKLELRG
jgi:hypothetical protein